MTDRILRFSQRGYYLSFALIIFSGLTGFLSAHFVHIDKVSEAGIALQSLAFILLLTTLPGALWWFHRGVGQLKLMQEVSQQEVVYKRIVVVRFAVVNFNIILNILFFFFFADKSFFMCAAMAAIILLFCRPNVRNIESDMGLLHESEEDEETEFN